MRGLVLAMLLGGGGARTEDPPVEVRVLSGPGPATTVAIRARPDAVVEDRTPGARPATEPRGPVSSGETFAGEVTLFLRGVPLGRAAAIEVADPVVSVVRLFPEGDGTAVIVFVRQPVTYTVSRPSPSGEVAVALSGRTRPLTVVQKPRRTRTRRPEPRPGEDEDEVAVDAESLSYDQQTNTLTARGGVTLTRGDTTLTADEVVYDRTNAVAEARGNVVLTDPQGMLQGELARLDLQDETGWVETADGVLQPSNYLLRAGRIEKKGGPRYSVADGVFTTCECGGLERPSWSLAARETDVTLEGTGVARGVSFRVKDVPVLHVPWLLFPANTQRQSGFLLPRVGYSNRRGFQYEQPFFWAIDKSQDATVALDVETAARLGVIGEYRYALSRQTRGAFAGAYYNETIGGQDTGTRESTGEEGNVPVNRWAIAGRHTQPFFGKSRLYVEPFVVSDKLFLKDMDTFTAVGSNDLGLRTLRFTQSRIGVYRGWGQGFARVDAAYFQDLIEQATFDPDLLVLQRLPRIEAEHSVPLFGDRLVGRLAGEAIDYQRREGFDGLRADLAPELFLPFRLGRALSGSVSGQLRETAYYLTDTEQVAFVVPDGGFGFLAPAPELPRLDPWRNRELAIVQARTGTSFGRVFDFPYLGLRKLRHTIDPEVRYLYVPQVGRPTEERRIDCSNPLRPGEQPGVNCNVTLFSEGYLWDDRDAINRRNFLSWGFTTRLWARPATPAAASSEPARRAAPVDPDVVAPGVSADALPEIMGPPKLPAAAGAPGAAPPAIPPAREFARLSVLNGYDVSREIAGDSHLSDVDLGLRLAPLDWVSLSYDTTVGTDQADLRGLSVSLVAREPWWTPPPVLRNLQSPATVGIAYRFIEQDREVEPGTEQLVRAGQGLNAVDGSVYLRLGNYVGFTFLARYDLSTTPVLGGGELGPHFLERNYFLRLISRCNCWVMEAGMSDTFNPDERLFRIQLTLVGLGSFGQGPAARNYVGFAPLATGASGPAPAGYR